MAEFDQVKIKAKNFKCFGDNEQGFDKICPVNLIIGRNNSGKSSLLDLIDYIIAPKDISQSGHLNKSPEVIVTASLIENDIQFGFKPGTSGGPIPGNHWEYGKQWLSKDITWSVSASGDGNFISVDPEPDDRVKDKFIQIASKKKNPFAERVFKRLQPNRDISPEGDDHQPNLSANGSGATTIICHYLTKASLPTKMVEETLLIELNKIFEPDLSFSDISVQRLDNNKWEIFLGETKKGRISLSNSGSGLKTIILVLVFLLLVPHNENKNLERYVFGFEELENNLHPSLLRRLLLYLRETAVKNKCIFFITTHSSVTIDLFSSDDKAQLLHVIHDGEKSEALPVLTYVERKGVLDDLDIRASDILQSNGVVWVEGPSDRKYFNRWVELWSEGTLHEGTHYMCVFYGGKLLAHLSADNPDIKADDLVKILRLNRNGLIIIDSDRSKKGEKINTTKQRLREEIEDLGGIAWITAGTEIENYIPSDVLRTHFEDEQLSDLGQYESISDFISSFDPSEEKRFNRNKVLFAENICPLLTKENLTATFDFTKVMEKVYHQILEWN